MRSVSSEMLRDIQSQETGEAFLVLVTISSDDLPSSLRVTSDSTKTVSNGETYLPYPFEFIPPNDSEEGSTNASIRIDNIDREIVRAVRTAQSTPKITVRVVRGSAPDTVEVEWPNFDLKRVEYDQFVVSGEIGLESYLTEAYPKDTFTPHNFAGLF